MSQNHKLQIRANIRCPSCWAEIEPADLLWVSSHPDLRGDPFLGDDALKRFLPSRFDVDGFALDANDVRCQFLACPSCHLTVPRILVEFKPLFVSVIGAPSSGKSYFLASSVWKAREKLGEFCVSFTDADPVANRIISEYEQKLFLSDRPSDLVAIPKTEEDGELYRRVDYGTRVELYARPFVFTMQPNPNHILMKNRSNSRTISRALCLYDNAGEHFQPTVSSELSPATDHLALSEALIFVFDPLQHPRFREHCRKHSPDPQLGGEFRLHRQDEILLEAAKRIRQKANLPHHERFTRPLIVAVNKFDVWRKLVPKFSLDHRDLYRSTSDGVMAINLQVIEEVSRTVHKLLSKIAPEVVAACESFSTDVTYVPTSPQGCSPEVAESAGGLLGVRPSEMKPLWAEVPLLYAIARAECDLILCGAPRNTEQKSPTEQQETWPPRIARGTGR